MLVYSNLNDFCLFLLWKGVKTTVSEVLKWGKTGCERFEEKKSLVIRLLFFNKL